MDKELEFVNGRWISTRRGPELILAKRLRIWKFPRTLKSDLISQIFP